MQFQVDLNAILHILKRNSVFTCGIISAYIMNTKSIQIFMVMFSTSFITIAQNDVIVTTVSYSTNFLQFFTPTTRNSNYS